MCFPKKIKQISAKKQKKTRSNVYGYLLRADANYNNEHIQHQRKNTIIATSNNKIPEKSTLTIKCNQSKKNSNFLTFITMSPNQKIELQIST